MCLPSPSGSTVEFEVRTENLSGARVEVIQDGRILQPEADLAIKQAAQTLRFAWRSDGGRHWLRVNVRGADGKLLLVGNPIYLNWPAPARP